MLDISKFECPISTLTIHTTVVQFPDFTSSVKIFLQVINHTHSKKSASVVRDTLNKTNRLASHALQLIIVLG